MIQDLESKRWIQIGTVAGSTGDCGDINLPGIYVRLNHPSVSNFIDSVIFPLKKQTKGKMKEVISAKAFLDQLWQLLKQPWLTLLASLANWHSKCAVDLNFQFFSIFFENVKIWVCFKNYLCNCLSHYI